MKTWYSCSTLLKAKQVWTGSHREMAMVQERWGSKVLNNGVLA